MTERQSNKKSGESKEPATNYGTSEFEDIRKTLFDQYHTHVTTHTGLIIAIIIGSLTLFSRWDSFFGGAVPLIGFFFTFSFIVGLTFYVMGRLSYWASISNSILIMKEKHFESFHYEYSDEPCICSAQVLAEIMTKNNESKSLHYLLSRLSVKQLLICSGLLILVTYIVLSSIAIWLQLPYLFSFFE